MSTRLKYLFSILTILPTTSQGPYRDFAIRRDPLIFCVNGFEQLYQKELWFSVGVGVFSNQKGNGLISKVGSGLQR